MNPIQIERLFLAALLLTGTTLWTRIANQAVEPKGLAIGKDGWVICGGGKVLNKTIERMSYEFSNCAVASGGKDNFYRGETGSG